MSNPKLDATKRENRGKGAARRLRMSGEIPAIVYGGKSETVSVAISPKYLTRILLGPKRRNTVIDLNVDGSTQQVMVRDVQKNVIRREPIHVDFIKVSDDAPVTVAIPFRTKGRSKSVVAGGKLNVTARQVRVSVLPSKIPEDITIDVTDAPFGTLRAGAIDLPEGCTLVEDPHTALLTIKTPRGAKASDGEGEGEAAEA